MRKTTESSEESLHRRSYGVHLTSSEIFLKFIFPVIKEKIWEYKWVDLYAGEGNLILPILDSIPPADRINFFKTHIYLSDIQEEMLEKCIKKAVNYGIPPEVAMQNIELRDNLEQSPDFLKDDQGSIFHITNPPYLYLGYIRKHKETQKYLKLFEGKNNGYQDLYQIAMLNDLRNQLNNLIYIIPTNFLFGSSVSNKFRRDFLKYYRINKMLIFETKIFEFTGTNICIGFFERKKIPKSEVIKFEGTKFKKQNVELRKVYILKPKYKYRAGSEFDEFLEENRVDNPLNVNYYLLKKEILNNKGSNKVSVIDANNYKNSQYNKIDLRVNDNLKAKIESNILYIRTVDTGSINGRVGLGIITEDFDVNGIYVSGNTYRTHPIQIFLDPELSHNDQILLKNYFNLLLESFRKKLDSEFLTTYKYSNAEYTRKYLGLTQVRNLIQTFPYKNLNQSFQEKLSNFVGKKDLEKFLELLR
ncbi:MAG: N-6 DNA methylase [Candidatus Lokiarchaeota archaeon]|nr:N-6 DNA methylase [Candidatus Lokiarchaeota archaeon]